MRHEHDEESYEVQNGFQSYAFGTYNEYLIITVYYEGKETNSNVMMSNM